MKKFLTIAIGVLFMAYSSANAQSSKRSNIDYTSLGPIAGFGHSWLSGMDNQDFKPSIQLGIGMIYSKYEHLGIGADFSVSHEGYRMENELTNTEWTVNPVYLRLTPKLYYFFGEYGALVRLAIFIFTPAPAVSPRSASLNISLPVSSLLRFSFWQCFF